jgi:hypothetical protein
MLVKPPAVLTLLSPVGSRVVTVDVPSNVLTADTVAPGVLLPSVVRAVLSMKTEKICCPGETLTTDTWQQLGEPGRADRQRQVAPNPPPFQSPPQIGDTNRRTPLTVGWRRSLRPEAAHGTAGTGGEIVTSRCFAGQLLGSPDNLIDIENIGVPAGPAQMRN